MRRLALAAVLVLLTAVPAHPQVEARQADPSESKQPAPQTEVPSPMLLEVPLAGNGTPSKPHIIDLPFERKRVVKDTATFVCDQMTVESVAIRRLRGRKGKISLGVAPSLRTEYFRQKVDLRLTLLDAEGKEIGREWSKRVVLGFKATDLTPGAVGLTGMEKDWSEEAAWEFESEQALRDALGGESKLRIVATIVE